MEWGQISILAQKKPTWVVAQVAVPLSSWSHSPPGKQEREHRTGGAVRRCRQRVPCSPTDPQLYSSGVKDALQWCHAAGPELPPPAPRARAQGLRQQHFVARRLRVLGAR